MVDSQLPSPPSSSLAPFREKVPRGATALFGDFPAQVERAVRTGLVLHTSPYAMLRSTVADEVAQSGVHSFPLRDATGGGPAGENLAPVVHRRPELPAGTGGALGPAWKLESAGLEAGCTGELSLIPSPWGTCPAQGVSTLHPRTI